MWKLKYRWFSLSDNRTPIQSSVVWKRLITYDAMSLIPIDHSEAETRHSILLAKGRANLFLLRNLWAISAQVKPSIHEIFRRMEESRLNETLPNEEPNIPGKKVFVDILSKTSSAVFGHAMTTTLDSALLVLAHSILDEALNGYLELCMDLTPHEWERELDRNTLAETLKSSTVKWADVKSIGLDGLLGRLFKNRSGRNAGTRLRYAT